jgi:hypothetical protein
MVAVKVVGVFIAFFRAPLHLAWKQKGATLETGTITVNIPTMTASQKMNRTA